MHGNRHRSDFVSCSSRSSRLDQRRDTLGGDEMVFAACALTEAEADRLGRSLSIRVCALCGHMVCGLCRYEQCGFHRDPMLGDGWSTPIGNGYAIDMIDVTDHGFLHPGGDLNGPGSIADVRRLQIAYDQIYGTADSKVMQNFATGLQGEDEFFHLDTRTHSKDNFTSEAQLAVYARKQGLQLRLKPIAEVYNSFRFTWFYWFALALLFGLPNLSFARLLFHLRAYKQAHLSTSDN